MIFIEADLHLSTQVKQHWETTRKCETEKSAISQHAWSKHQQISVSLLDYEPYTKTKESSRRLTYQNEIFYEQIPRPRNLTYLVLSLQTSPNFHCIIIIMHAIVEKCLTQQSMQLSVPPTTYFTQRQCILLERDNSQIQKLNYIQLVLYINNTFTLSALNNNYDFKCTHIYTHSFSCIYSKYLVTFDITYILKSH